MHLSGLQNDDDNDDNDDEMDRLFFHIFSPAAIVWNYTTYYVTDAVEQGALDNKLRLQLICLFTLNGEDTRVAKWLTNLKTFTCMYEIWYTCILP